jgi:hypothetical protein
VALSTQEALDSARGVELSATFTLTNVGDRAITLLYRPELLLFTVVGPKGTVSCGFPKLVAAPIRELYTTLAPGGKAESTMLFSATCPSGTFDEPGIYRVFPRLDTTGASGRTVGLKTWGGVAQAKRPLVVRVRTARKPVAPPRPALD